MIRGFIGGIFIAILGVIVMVASDVWQIGLGFLAIGIVMFTVSASRRRKDSAQTPAPPDHVALHFEEAQSRPLEAPKTEVTGSITINFYSSAQASILDDIPRVTADNWYTSAFPFALASKLLYNYPPPSGDAVLDAAIRRLDERLAKADPKDPDVSLLGIFCDSPLEIVGGRSGKTPGEGKTEPGRWVYRAEMFRAGDGIGMKTTIPVGNEAHFHAASIDLVFEWTRATAWKLGSLMCTSEAKFLHVLRESGIQKIQQNYTLSVGMAREMWEILIKAYESR